jgi:hypothetical protein
MQVSRIGHTMIDWLEIVDVAIGEHWWPRVMMSARSFNGRVAGTALEVMSPPRRHRASR